VRIHGTYAVYSMISLLRSDDIRILRMIFGRLPSDISPAGRLRCPSDEYINKSLLRKTQQAFMFAVKTHAICSSICAVTSKGQGRPFWYLSNSSHIHSDIRRTSAPLLPAICGVSRQLGRE